LSVANPAMDIDKVTQRARRCLQNWMDLRPPAVSIRDARDKVLDYNVDDFGTDYLLHRGDLSTFAETYWENVFNATFIALANECAKNADDAAQSLSNLKKFPLSDKDAGPGLTIQQIRKAKDLIDTLTPVQQPAANPNSMALHGSSHYNDLSAAIEDMKGSKAVKSVDPAWIADVRPLLDALAKDELQCRLTIVSVGDVAENGKDSVRHVWRYVNARVDGKGTIFPSALQIDENTNLNRDAALPPMHEAAGRDLQLLLYENSDEKISKQVSIGNGNWPYLRLIMPDKTHTVDPSDASGMQFDVNYFVDNTYRIPLKVSFSAPRVKDFKLPSWFTNSK
ncbi:MAG TPA: hypothetical protein VFW23_19370, partial [Tepidisphaeraceae bacterium]|nr:hypothetical protein [Tepidisphaeraceae bacterium]